MADRTEKPDRRRIGWITYGFTLLLGIVFGSVIASSNRKAETEWGEVSYDLLLVASEAPLLDEQQTGSEVVFGGEHPNVQSNRTWRIVDHPTLVTSVGRANVYGTLCGGRDGRPCPIGKTHLMIHVVPKSVEERVSTEIRINYERQKSLYRLELGSQETRAIQILSPGPGRSEYCYLFVSANPIAVTKNRPIGTAPLAAKASWRK